MGKDSDDFPSFVFYSCIQCETEPRWLRYFTRLYVMDVITLIEEFFHIQIYIYIYIYQGVQIDEYFRPLLSKLIYRNKASKMIIADCFHKKCALTSNESLHSKNPYIRLKN